MPQVIVPAFQATLGTLTYSELKKPVGPKVVLRRICLYARGTNIKLSFALVYGRLVDNHNSFHIKSVFKTWTSDVGVFGPETLFEGEVEWPHEWTLHFGVRTQTANTSLFYIIDYDIIEPEKPRRWW